MERKRALAIITFAKRDVMTFQVKLLIDRNKLKGEKSTILGVM